ncbi:MAG: hypothetical protein WBP29_03325 [Candidatus Zixiibacteriota bacterium]
MKETSDNGLAALNVRGCDDDLKSWNRFRQAAMADRTLAVLGTMLVVMFGKMQSSRANQADKGKRQETNESASIKHLHIYRHDTRGIQAQNLGRLDIAAIPNLHSIRVNSPHE